MWRQYLRRKDSTRPVDELQRMQRDSDALLQRSHTLRGTASAVSSSLRASREENHFALALRQAMGGPA